MRTELKPYISLLVLGLALAAQDAPLAQELHARVQDALPMSLEQRPPKGSRLRAMDLDHIVQPITTVTEYPDGRKEVNTGSGFIVGRRYFTVQHNLTSITPSASGRKTIYLDGIPLTPSYADAEYDVAVFELPDDLCERYCNHVSFGTMPELQQDRKVYWLRKFQDEFVFKKGKVLNYAFMGEAPDSSDPYGMQGCNANLIVEVDTPFIPGSSGAPVLDTATGQIIGIIQGSFESASGRSGYFKPIHCVVPFVAPVAEQLS